MGAAFSAARARASTWSNGRRWGPTFCSPGICGHTPSSPASRAVSAAYATPGPTTAPEGPRGTSCRRSSGSRRTAPSAYARASRTSAAAIIRKASPGDPTAGRRALPVTYATSITLGDIKRALGDPPFTIHGTAAEAVRNTYRAVSEGTPPGSAGTRAKAEVGPPATGGTRAGTVAPPPSVVGRSPSVAGRRRSMAAIRTVEAARRGTTVACPPHVAASHTSRAAP